MKAGEKSLQEVTQKEGESFENMMRRFGKKVQQAGTLASVRKNMYFEKPLSKRAQREIAIRKRERKELKAKSYQ